ncbi:MAG: SPASM domain-containing protein, partial [Clostridia bacterium]
GSYDLVLPKMKRLAESRNQQRYYVRGTFTAHNLDFANDVLHLADEGFEQISVEPVVADDACEYALRQEHLPQILNEYEKLAQSYLVRRQDGRWFNFFHFMIDLAGGPCLRKRLTGCGAGNEYVAVTPEGDIYPCHQFVGREGFRMGSVLDDTFDREMQQRFANNHVLSKESCRDCWARFYCSGGCAANAHAKHGDISKPYALECEMERKRLECAMAIYAIEHSEA